MATTKIVSLRVPVELDCPWDFGPGDVFDAEFDVPYYGDHLVILDIGAYIGTFALWASLRWPQSQVHCYEPNPAAFGYLQANTARRGGITLVNAAVSSSPLRLFVRQDREWESTAQAHAARMFATLDGGELLDVAAFHPKDLPPADIIKIDVEGGELDVLNGIAGLPRASLILVDYHFGATRDRIVDLLGRDFDLVRESSNGWNRLLNVRAGYNPALAGDRYGTLCFANKRLERLRRIASRAISAPPGLRDLLGNLPGALARSIRSRLGVG